jgi:hypothetical protein
VIYFDKNEWKIEIKIFRKKISISLDKFKRIYNDFVEDDEILQIKNENHSITVGEVDKVEKFLEFTFFIFA